MPGRRPARPGRGPSGGCGTPAGRTGAPDGRWGCAGACREARPRSAWGTRGFGAKKRRARTMEARSNQGGPRIVSLWVPKELRKGFRQVGGVLPLLWPSERAREAHKTEHARAQKKTRREDRTWWAGEGGGNLEGRGKVLQAEGSHGRDDQPWPGILGGAVACGKSGGGGGRDKRGSPRRGKEKH